MKKLIIAVTLTGILCIVFFLTDRNKKDLQSQNNRISQSENHKKHVSKKNKLKIKHRTDYNSDTPIKFKNCGSDIKCKKKEEILSRKEKHDLEILKSDSSTGL